MIDVSPCVSYLFLNNFPRWRRFDVHDIVVDCANLSLDLIEGSYEETKCPVIGSLKYPQGQEKEMHPYMTDKLNGSVALYCI